MSRSYHAVIFDMDGLILDTEPIYKRAWQKAGEELGFPIDDAFYDGLVGLRTEDAMATMHGKFGAEFREEVFHESWLREWKEIVRRETIPIKPGFDDLLEEIEEHGLRTAIATSTERDRAAFSLRAAGLEGCFPTKVAGDEIANGKPAPDIYLEAARRLDVQPDRCIVLEDSEPGVLAAHAADMTVLMVPDMTRPSDEVSEAAFRVLPSLHEVRQVMFGSLLQSTSDESIPL